jgi:hypothetical protein
MPRTLTTDSPPDEPASIRIQVPGWMKNRASIILLAQGKTLTDWIKDQMRELIARDEAANKGTKRRR